MKKIIAIPGSLREKSYNRAVCRYFESLNNTEAIVEVVDLQSLPFFNQDLESDLPLDVKAFIDKIKQADALIISTPEYGNMVPGVLKNALEWLSRGYSREAIAGKPVLITGASTGGFGTVRAQNQLLLLLTLLRCKIDAGLRLPISHAQDKINDAGEITDAETKLKMDEMFAKLVANI